MKTAWKVLGAVGGAVLALVAAALIAGGAGLLWAWGVGRDDGRFTTPEVTLEADGYAIVSEELDLGAHPGDWIPSGTLADLRLSVGSGAGDVFIGVAEAEDVNRYLDGVPHALVTSIDGSNVGYETIGGTNPPSPPLDVDIWEASAVGTPPLSLGWELGQGTWTVVAMNADGSTPVDVTVSASAAIGWLVPAAVGVLIVGLLFGLVAAGILVAVFAPRRDEQPMAPSHHGVEPVAIEGSLDPGLSRGLWLVKWFLAIPHLFVLAFLWAGFVFTTIAAGISILFTGRYPKALFDFNVGVMRWSWRVAFYAFDALGTDEYPPFTLEPADYPATLDVRYPGELSRGLVLVKWLLAIPHLVVIGLFTSGLVWWTTDVGGAGSDTVLEVGGGLISVLTLIAGVGLLVTGRYPRPVFDLLMGLNRWVYRVVAYVALMTDEYPPFRLDQGGSEPAPPTDPEGTGGSDSRERTPTPA